MWMLYKTSHRLGATEGFRIKVPLKKPILSDVTVIAVHGKVSGELVRDIGSSSMDSKHNTCQGGQNNMQIC